MSFDGLLSFQVVQKQNTLLRHLRNWGELSFNSVEENGGDN